MTLGEIIKQYREEHDISQRAFARLAGVSNAYVSMLENNKNTKTGLPVVPSLTLIRKTAAVMGIPLNDMVDMLGDSPMALEDQNSFCGDNLPDNVKTLSNADLKRVRVLGGIAAGAPVIDEERDAYIFTDLGKADFAMQVEGDSMEPTFRNGDIVFIRQQDTVEDGQIAAVATEEGWMLKHVYTTPAGLQLVSENPKYPPRSILPEEHDFIRILGRAIGYQRVI